MKTRPILGERGGAFGNEQKWHEWQWGKQTHGYMHKERRKDPKMVGGMGLVGVLSYIPREALRIS